MSLNLIKRLEKGVPLTAEDHDENLDKIEVAIEDRLVRADLSYNQSSRVLSITSGEDVTLPLVTDSLPGLLSASDKVKLNSIQSGAEINVNADWNASSGSAQILNKPVLGSAAFTEVSAYATASQGAKADTAVQPSELLNYVQTGDSRMSDAREWTASTISQEEAETGTATTRRAWTAQRVFQAVASWWASSSAKTKLDGIASGATANSSDATLLNRENHTGTQSASTITGLAEVATSGAYGDLSGIPTLGTAAEADVGDFATAAQGAKADSAVQPAALSGYVQTSDSRLTTDLNYDAATREVRSSTGADATLPLATTSAAGLQPASGYGSISYAAQVTLNFSTLDQRMNTISLTGDLELLTSNLANGREVRLRLVCDGTQRTLTFPIDWRFVGTKPAKISAFKVAILSLASFGTTNADVVAAYAVQS